MKKRINLENSGVDDDVVLVREGDLEASLPQWIQDILNEKRRTTSEENVFECPCCGNVGQLGDCSCCPDCEGPDMATCGCWDHDGPTTVFKPGVENLPEEIKNTPFPDLTPEQQALVRSYMNEF
jgi:hypothetical protein